MTSTPSLPAQIEAVRDTIMAGERVRLTMKLSPLTDWNQDCLRAVLVTLQQYERLEAVVTAARVYNRCRSVSNERLMRDALAALDTAAPSNEVELELSRRDTKENVAKF